MEDYIWTGDFLNNKYYVCTKIGKGKFSTIWLSYDIHKKNHVVIKIHNQDAVTEGNQEIKVLQEVSKSKYIMRMLDNFIIDKTFVCIVMDMMYASSYDFLKMYNNGIPYELTKKIIKTCLHGMKELNDKKYIHSDIKPENILISGENPIYHNDIKIMKSGKIEKIIESCKKKYKTRFDDKVKEKIISLFNMDDFDLDEKQNDIKKDENKKTYPRYLLESSDEEKFEEDFLKDEPKINFDKFKCKLSDLGNCFENDQIHFKIQTRHYRAPEVILNYKINEKIDVWSIGCMVYEYLCDKVLYMPNKNDYFSRDRHHLYEIQKHFGMIPKEIIDKSIKKDTFYRSNYLIKGIDKFKHESFIDLLENDIGHKIPKNEYDICIDFILKCLTLDIDKRMSVSECLSHKFLL